MAITDLPIMNMLRTKMQWHQERQRVLAENVANADTPEFKPRDLVAPKFDDAAPRLGAVALARTDPAHIGGGGTGSAAFALARGGQSETRPTGNSVSLEDEMIKVAANAMDYQAAATLYSRSLGLIKIALAKK